MLSFRPCISVIRTHSRSLKLQHYVCPISLSPYHIPNCKYSTTKLRPTIKTTKEAKPTTKTKNKPTTKGDHTKKTKPSTTTTTITTTKLSTKTKPTRKEIKATSNLTKQDASESKPTANTKIRSEIQPRDNSTTTAQEQQLEKANNDQNDQDDPAAPPTSTQAQDYINPHPTSSPAQSTNTSRVHHTVAPDVYPVVAIVGRPNVGKSTLFNRFALGDKRALIGDVAGTTRDRDYTACRWYGRELIVVDTGGIVGEGGDKYTDETEGGGQNEGAEKKKKQMSLAAMVREQALIAISEASSVVFVLDIHDGVTQHDLIIARMLRRRGKNIIVVVNKADNQNLREFYFQEHKVEYERLGFGEPIVTSAIHGEGFLDIMERVVAPYPETPEDDKAAKEIRIAIVGQPNAGKSSLLNKITGEERAVVSPIAGTTADPVDTLITWRGSHLVRLIDTAGIWKRATDPLARAAVIWALRVVQRAHVVILVIDGTVGVTEHDKHVAGFILEHMKSVVCAVNKWDVYPKFKRERQGKLPKRDKRSHYEWHLHARDLAQKVMRGDRAGIAAWERGDAKKGKKHKHEIDKDTTKKQPGRSTEEEKVDEEESQGEVEVVKRNAKQSDTATIQMSELTRDLLESEAQQEKKTKFRKGKEAANKHVDDEIDFDKLEDSAVEFEIPLSSPDTPSPSSSPSPPSSSSNEERANQPRKRRHKPTDDEVEYEEAARVQLRFLPFVPFTFISATTGYRVPSLMDLAVEVFQERGIHIKTQDMFEVLRTASLRHKLPGKGRNLLRVRFASQVEAYPPTFVFFVNNPDAVQQHYERFLETCIREKYQFLGTPIRLLFKKNSNKYTKDKK